MASQVEICNLALVICGADTIIDLDEQSAGARVCKSVWNSSYRHVLCEHPWRKAMERKAMTRESTDPIAGYAYRYILPTSPVCLKVIDVTYVGGSSVGDYHLFGKYIECNVDNAYETLYCEYIKLVEDVTDLDPHTADALSHYIAYRIAPKVSRKSSSQKWLLEQYAAFLELAKEKDVQVGKQGFDFSSTWTSGRRT